MPATSLPSTPPAPVLPLPAEVVRSCLLHATSNCQRRWTGELKTLSAPSRTRYNNYTIVQEHIKRKGKYRQYMKLHARFPSPFYVHLTSVAAQQSSSLYICFSFQSSLLYIIILVVMEWVMGIVSIKSIQIQYIHW